MRFTEYISTHHIFQTRDLLTACDSAASAEEQLRIAAKTGKVDRIKRGLYTSMVGRFQDVPLDSLEVILGIDPDALVCYHTALDVLGVVHNISFQREFRTDKLKASFKYQGIRYVPYPPVAKLRTRTVRTNHVEDVETTTKEQTLCDCLAKLDRAGGLEEVIRAVSSFVYIDCNALLEILQELDKTTIARVGWLLSEKALDWKVPQQTLVRIQSLLAKGPYRLGSTKMGSKGWSPQWKLIFPEPLHEVESWITTN